MLDSVFKVATADVQDKAITLAKLADEVINMVIPSGMISAFAGPSPPGGWYVCDGTERNRNTDGKLFAAIGTYWGVGNNTTTFNLPDLRGRVPIGYVNIAAPGITFRGFATRLGEENHQLLIGEIPSHNHTLHDGTHTHSYTVSAAIQQAQAGGGTWSNVQQAATTSASGANISIDPVGGSGAHNIMQPFSVLYFIVKA